MEFTDLNRQTLSKLGLLPLKKWQFFRNVMNNNGVMYRYNLNNPTATEKYVYMTVEPSSDGTSHIIESDYAGELHISSIDDITEDLLRDEFCFTDLMIKKYMWLKKYLKGEVNGRYNKYDSVILDSGVNAKIEQLQNKIGFLMGKIQRLETEKDKLSAENARLKAENFKLESVKTAIDKYNKTVRKHSHE